MIRRSLTAVVVAVLLAGFGVTGCTPPATVTALLTTVDPGRSVFHVHDSQGHTMDTVKIVEDPSVPGRYLAVYHYWTGSTYVSSVATSFDLRTWTFQRAFDISGSQPYLAFGPNGEPVIADEAFTNAHLRFFYWSSVASLLGGTAPVRQHDSTRSLSKCAEGTPDIRSVSGGSMTSSTIVLGMHYFQNCSTDREAVGNLTNFSSFAAATGPDIDTAMTNAGAPGKHGDRDHFTIGSNSYLLLEGSTNSTPATFDFSLWRNQVYDGATATEITPNTPNHSTAFANPSTTVLHDPNGTLSLLVTQFIPTSAAGTGESGELIYWNPIT